MTFPQNTPSIDQLINLPAGEIAQLPVELLAALQREIDAAAKQMKAVTARFSTALEVRYAARTAEARHARGKDTGTVRIVDGDFTVVADFPRRSLPAGNIHPGPLRGLNQIDPVERARQRLPRRKPRTTPASAFEHPRTGLLPLNGDPPC